MPSVGVPSRCFLLCMEGNHHASLESSTIQTCGDPCHNVTCPGHDPILVLADISSLRWREWRLARPSICFPAHLSCSEHLSAEVYSWCCLEWELGLSQVQDDCRDACSNESLLGLELPMPSSSPWWHGHRYGLDVVHFLLGDPVLSPWIIGMEPTKDH
jgi:hypothetical protein